ncbi:MAG: hypothetical protein ACI8RZ_001946 [Myxococcota bacterium]|jgi:hypothetical protein
MQSNWIEDSRIVIQGATMMERILMITQRAEVDGGMLYQTITIKEDPQTKQESLSTTMVFVPAR